MAQRPVTASKNAAIEVKRLRCWEILRIPMTRAARINSTAIAPQPSLIIPFPNGILGPALPRRETKKIHWMTRAAAPSSRPI